jgi:hypothetical protein
MAPLDRAWGGGLMLKLIVWPPVVFAVVLVAAWALLKLLWTLAAVTVEVLTDR